MPSDGLRLLWGGQSTKKQTSRALSSKLSDASPGASRPISQESGVVEATPGARTTPLPARFEKAWASTTAASVSGTPEVGESALKRLERDQESRRAQREAATERARVMQESEDKKMMQQMQGSATPREDNRGQEQTAKDREVHNDRMRHDPDYKRRFLRHEKNKRTALLEGTSGLAAEVARLSKRVEQREKEREMEDSRVKEMMRTIQQTIKRTANEFGIGEIGGENDIEDGDCGSSDAPTSTATSVASVSEEWKVQRASEEGSRDSLGSVKKSANKRGGNRDVQMLMHHASMNRAVVRKPISDAPCSHLIYEEGDEQGRQCYIGQLQDSKRHGLGVLKFTDGSKYSGDWRNDHPCGHGVEKYSATSLYSGEFLEDRRHGYGQFEVSPDVSYCGQFQDGEMHGMLYILEIDSRNGGILKLTSARADRGQIYREPQYDELEDDDPRKALASTMQKVVAALQAKVFTAVSTARAASQEAHDLALEVSRDASTTHRSPATSSRPRSTVEAKIGSDAGQLIEEKPEKQNLTVEEIFHNFSTRAASGPDKKRLKASSMDFRGWTEMLTAMTLFPRVVDKHKAQEIFRLANRRSGVANEDSAKMDQDEFQYAYQKLADFLFDATKASVEKLWRLSKEGTFPLSSGKGKARPAPQRKTAETSPSSNHKVISIVNDPSEMEEKDWLCVKDLFAKFTVSAETTGGANQASQRRASIRSKDFIAALTYLTLLPHKISNKTAVETFTRAKRMCAGSKTEVDFKGFVWALRRLQKSVDFKIPVKWEEAEMLASNADGLEVGEGDSTALPRVNGAGVATTPRPNSRPSSASSGKWESGSGVSERAQGDAAVHRAREKCEEGDILGAYSARDEAVLQYSKLQGIDSSTYALKQASIQELTKRIKDVEGQRATQRMRAEEAMKKARELAAKGDILGAYAARDEVASLFDNPFLAAERNAAIAEINKVLQDSKSNSAIESLEAATSQGVAANERQGAAVAAAGQALSRLEESIKEKEKARDKENQAAAHEAAGNAALASARGKLASYDFTWAHAARNAAASFFQTAGPKVWREKQGMLAMLDSEIKAAEDQSQQDSKLAAHGKSGDSALTSAREKLAAGDIAGANAAASAAASFYSMAGKHGEKKRQEMGTVDRLIMEAAQAKLAEEDAQRARQTSEEEARRLQVRIAEAETERWKREAEAAKLAYMPRSGDGSVGTEQATGGVIAASEGGGLRAQENGEVRLAQRALDLMAAAKREAETALSAMQRAFEREEGAKAAQEAVDAQARRAEEELRALREAEVNVLQEQRRQEREALWRKRQATEEKEQLEREAERKEHERVMKAMNELPEDERWASFAEFGGKYGYEFSLVKPRHAQRDIANWPKSREEETTYAVASRARLKFFQTEAVPRLQSVLRRRIQPPHSQRARAAKTLERMLQCKWEQVDGESRLREGRIMTERERQERERQQRKRLEAAAEAKRQVIVRGPIIFQAAARTFALQ